MTTRTAAILLGLLLAATPARAQESAPVMVDASPSAAELLRRADEAAAVNPAESARLVQQVLDGFARKLVPWPPEPDRFRSATAAAEDFLRTHPAVRERWLRQEGPTAERAVAAGELVETVRARAGTPAALQAMLALAQRAMDDGRTFDARAWIARADRHPMADEALRMRLAKARADLEALDRAPVLAAAPAAASGAATTPDWQPLWSAFLPTAWLSRLAVDLETGVPRRGASELASDGSALASAPRFSGDALLVADGTTVQALDRFSGSVLWRAQVGSASDRSSQPLGDLTVAAPMGDMVVTLPGHAQPDQRSGAPRIVALDRATGRRRWEMLLSSLQLPEFEDLFPHGEPVLVGDLVIVQARKSNSRLESAAWLLALDAGNGTLRWAVPLGAAGGMRLAASRPLSSPVALGDDLVAASSLGVVTRLDGATGEPRWLRRWPAPIREPRVNSPAWQLPSPVADERLVAWLAPDAATLVGLDPADGHTLWNMPIGVDTAYGAARTLLLAPDRLFAIGDDVVALDRADPTRIVWTLSRTLGRAPALRGAASMGTLGDGTRALVVPTAEAVLLLSPSDGALLGSWSLAAGANTALADGQLAASGAQSVSLAMQASDGERLLRERLAADPRDARRGLALLELGRAWKRPALVLDGAEAAAAALRDANAPQEGVRDELLQRLIERDTLAALPGQQAERLLQLAAGVARTPGQRAEVLITQATSAAAAGRRSQGVDLMRAVLAADDLRLALIRVDASRSVAAGVLALHELAALGDASAGARLQSLRIPVESHPMPAVGALQPMPRSLPGALVQSSEDEAGDRSNTRVLLKEPLELSLRRTPDLSVVWRVPFVGTAPEVKSWSPAITLWSRAGADNGRLLSIDPASGEVRFQREGVAEFFETGATAASEVSDRSEARAIEALRAGEFLLLQRGDGRLVALRLDGHGEVAWKASSPVRIVHAACADAEAFALVGAGEGGEDSPEICVGRVRDGSVWLQGACPAGVGRPVWLALVPQGLAVGGSEGIAMLERAPGLPVRWLQRDPRGRGCDAVEAAGRWIVLADAQRRLAGVAIDDGEFRSPFLQSPSPGAENGIHAVHDLGGRWLVHGLNTLTLHAADGPMQGEAVGGPSRRHDEVAVADDAVVSVAIAQPDPMRSNSRAPEFAVRRHLLSQGLRQQGPPLVVESDGLRLVHLVVLDGWVLLGGDDRTIAIPAPAGRESPR